MFVSNKTDSPPGRSRKKKHKSPISGKSIPILKEWLAITVKDLILTNLVSYVKKTSFLKIQHTKTDIRRHRKPEYSFID